MWITTYEAGKQTGFSESHLRGLAKKGFVKARKREGRWYFDSEVLLAYKVGWIGTRHASELTGRSRSVLRRLANKKQVPARKVSRVWLFQRRDLVAGAGALVSAPTTRPRPPEPKPKKNKECSGGV